MSPARSLFPLITWLLRLVILFVVYTRFAGIIEAFQTSDLIFFIALAYALFALLLFFGGFLKKHTLTIVSGFFLAALSVYQMVRLGFEIGNNLSFYALLATTGLLFVGLGNKK